MLLAIDTATRALSLALHDGQTVVAEHTWRTADHHSVELAPNAALMMRRAGVEPRQLSGLAVALGPGTYTGLRIGLGFAKGLALAHNVPLLGVPTFEIVMASQAPQSEAVLAVIPAGRGRVSAARYAWMGEWTLISPARIMAWAALAAELTSPTFGAPVFVCGEIEPGLRAVLHEPHGRGAITIAPPAQAFRRAGTLADIGWKRLRERQIDSAVTLAPIYGGAAP
jgi:tRNA threonylcarbamoyladenosine biosynthesis protein TsaB